MQRRTKERERELQREKGIMKKLQRPNVEYNGRWKRKRQREEEKTEEKEEKEEKEEIKMSESKEEKNEESENKILY